MAKKEVEVKTRAFELKVHVNTKVISTQLALFIGLVLVWFFAGNGAVRTLCTVFIVIDLLAVFVLLFDRKGENETKTDTDSNISHEEPATTEDKQQARKSPVRESDGVIRNKVPIPNPTPVRTIQREVAESTSGAQSINVETVEQEVDWGSVEEEINWGDLL